MDVYGVGVEVGGEGVLVGTLDAGMFGVGKGLSQGPSVWGIIVESTLSDSGMVWFLLICDLSVVSLTTATLHWSHLKIFLGFSPALESNAGDDTSEEADEGELEGACAFMFLDSRNLWRLT